MSEQTGKFLQRSETIMQKKKHRNHRTEKQIVSIKEPISDGLRGREQLRKVTLRIDNKEYLL